MRAPASRLAVNEPGDQYEQEADQVADQVMRMTEPVKVQRKCASCEDEEAALHRQVTGAGPVAAPMIVRDVLSSPSQPLDQSTRAFMELRFGHDFSKVRVHTGERAAESVRAVNAHAYTVGPHIVFGARQYATDTVAGQTLLAHELAHTVQQGAACSSRVQRETADDDDAKTSEIASNEGTQATAAQETTKPTKEQKAACNRTILAEGTCADLVAGSRFICCDPDNGISRPGKKKDIDGKSCPSEQFTPIFTCDSTCAKALAKGCDDADNWMAVPGSKFKRSMCGDVFTICANGSQTTGYVRDRSVTASSFEVSPAIQTALGVPVGSSFKGAVYRPGAKPATIDADPCCNS
jgi:hypothetical protein